MDDRPTLPPHEAIRAARRAAGLSLRELARRIEVSPATLSAVENGRTGLSVARLARLAHETGAAVLLLDLRRAPGATIPPPRPARVAGVGPQV
ncbi:helix-turn-helix domain-containing protein, partial [Nocardia farcinica]|uniref:helix-turn-helix domain-containing protein n=1 Tax=Nocardia farcinica TaxID=37329 RepID=UPI0024541137